MANQNVIGQFKDEIGEVGSETATDVKDAIGEMIEQGVQSATSPQLTPQQLQQKQQADQKKEMDRQKQLVYTRNWLANLQMAQAKVRQEEKQKQMQKQQAEEQEKQVKKVEKIQLQQASKKPGVSEEVMRSQAERKAGKGVGG
ncbi:hypothetical protein HYS95_03515 [Candidatus Daviesbacteria bacterium]|nr:hypothetical protein [Candidatus Daviesbacteria bacterium]